jgi:hypothetical protein
MNITNTIITNTMITNTIITNAIINTRTLLITFINNEYY